MYFQLIFSFFVHVLLGGGGGGGGAGLFTFGRALVVMETLDTWRSPL